MAKAKLNEKYALSVEGLFDVQEDGNIIVDIEDIGEKNLAELIKKFSGCSAKLSISYGVELD